MATLFILFVLLNGLHRMRGSARFEHKVPKCLFEIKSHLDPIVNAHVVDDGVEDEIVDHLFLVEPRASIPQGLL
jgi:hypothetical protein